MKPKKFLAVAFLSASLLAFNPVFGIAADKKDVKVLINKAMQQEEEYTAEMYDANTSRKLKKIEKIEKIDEATERRTYFVVNYFETNGEKKVIETSLIIEDWKKAKNLKIKAPYAGNGGVAPEGYQIQRKRIVDTNFWSWDGIVDKYTDIKLAKDDKGNIISFKNLSKDINNPQVKKDVQETYDKYVKEMLDYIEKK